MGGFKDPSNMRCLNPKNHYYNRISQSYIMFLGEYPMKLFKVIVMFFFQRKIHYLENISGIFFGGETP